jgi:DNA polymerase-3 subunit alpha
MAAEESVPAADLPDEALQPGIPAPQPTYIIPPLSMAEGDSVYMITIQLRPSEDKVRDNIRIRQIYGTLITYPGRDRFAFHVFERGRGYLIEFPNFTTGLCPELIHRLKTFLPADLVRIEPITFQ